VVQLRDALLMNSGKNQSKKEKEAAYVNLKYQNCFLLNFSRAIMYCLFWRIDRGNYYFNFAAELLIIWFYIMIYVEKVLI